MNQKSNGLERVGNFWRVNHEQNRMDLTIFTNDDTINPIGAGGGAEAARTFFQCQFLNEKRVLKVQIFFYFS